MDGSTGLSLRAVARRAGVSPMAPSRHHPSRDALVSAVTAEGYRELAEKLAEAGTAPGDLAEIAVAYVRFALDRPAMFRVMFAEPCGPGDAERAAAVAAVSGYVRDLVAGVFPDTDPAPLADGVWALVHGLAFLHLDGKFAAADPDAVAARVRTTVHALLATRGA